MFERRSRALWTRIHLSSPPWKYRQIGRNNHASNRAGRISGARTTRILSPTRRTTNNSRDCERIAEYTTFKSIQVNRTNAQNETEPRTTNKRNESERDTLGYKLD